MLLLLLCLVSSVAPCVFGNTSPELALLAGQAVEYHELLLLLLLLPLSRNCCRRGVAAVSLCNAVTYEVETD